MQNLRRIARFATWILPLLLFFGARGLAESIRVTTWNLEWFPSGVANRILPEAEEKRIKAAAEAIVVLNPDVLLIQEIRDEDSCDRLVKAIAAASSTVGNKKAASPPLRYHVLVCSAFRDRVGGQGAGWQQVAILSKTPAEAAWASEWTTRGSVDPPRGFVFAALRFKNKNFGFYSVHLKSNLVRGENERERQLNILKRELSAEQLVEHSRVVAQQFPQGIAGFVLAGDLNTNREEFLSERTLPIFEEAGFVDPSVTLPAASRITRPSKGRYGNTTFDYILCRHVKPLGALEIHSVSVSDHLPVTLELELE